ncbi:CHASE2 domain-containing serine/threonine-protein kinase [Chitinimonas sp. BJB300]|uniref:CHASE2 domain-containing serine/threonine-protein kinase n=1 Tax=Chitinimonas sp. BJB300 TaxID=1559339 RepID=UPI000C10DFC4|nr:serine/threonine-protein kinase [Chitinimonas sp. BJB300]PHV10373.1 serine/threonine protein kinase [Chitinimonas sp. BJB300]TSJ87687.1 CHASE2 domain-containing protein [Chitinimonas sp. BJB300]
MKAPFWKTDWFVGLAVVVVFAVIGLTTNLLAALERKAYDSGLSLTERHPSDRVAIIAIDQTSIDNIGRWPWSRDVHAQLLDKLAAGKPKLIVSSVLFTEPQEDKGAVYIKQLLKLYREQRASHSAAEVAGAMGEVAAEPAGPDHFGALLEEAAAKLDFDSQLAVSVAHAGNVLLPMLLDPGEPKGNPDSETPAYVQRNEVGGGGDPSGGLPVPSIRMVAPIAAIGSKAAGIAHLTGLPDLADGVVRVEPLVMRYYDKLYPSLALLAVAKSLNLPPDQIVTKYGHSVQLGGLTLRTDANSALLTYFYPDQGNQPAFTTDSFFDVQSGKVPAAKFHDKIVLIGTTASGLGTTFVTPRGVGMSPVNMLAHNVSSIMQQQYFTAPSWAYWLKLLLCLLVGAYLMLLLPRLKAGPAAFLTAGLFTLLVVTHFILMSTQMIWLELMTPAALLLFGHLVLTTKRFLLTERGKEQSELGAAESNRMLGLAFQNQGQLDMAFDKFRKVPIDESMMDTLYNLALDFERKRQFNKAEMVYRYMAGFNPKFKDLDQKLSRAKQLAETVVLGGGGMGGNASTLILAGGAVEKPMLGRYQVEKELGKGAMGIVYLGKDPKIGRVVAIKTLALSQEFEADELEDARKRFFREAETAGRLNHPNIVTIYDAGEEHDLAYIAMEFLKGKDLVPHTKAGQLLPIIEVMNLIIQTAEALDYAHKQNVVHRDIKPANIMYETTTKIAKVTDFGIARITDSSKTRTGMVLGTPSYMSPEQLSGKKIDGRSDLFSLGVMLYQMTAGALPFVGESMAELMFRIANESYSNPKDLNPNLPDCLVDIIDKAMKKNADERFQTGQEFADALKQCAATRKENRQ